MEVTEGNIPPEVDVVIENVIAVVDEDNEIDRLANTTGGPICTITGIVATDITIAERIEDRAQSNQNEDPKEVGHSAVKGGKGLGFIGNADSTEVVLVSTHSGGQGTTEYHNVNTVFPEIRDILDQFSSSTGGAPLITLNQFQNTAHGGDDMVEEDSLAFSQGPSFVQWMKAPVEEVIQTPYKGVSIVTGHSCPEVESAANGTVEVECAVKDSRCRNLNGAFKEEEQLEATAA